MCEVWHPIPGFEHCGEVSNLGRIRSPRGKIRKTVVGNTGYARVGLKKAGAKNTNYVTVHRLVALAFCDGFSDGFVVNHINNIKSDNRAENLEWCSASENVRHAYSIGVRKECHRKAIIPKDHKQQLMDARDSGKTYRELGAIYGVTHSSMYRFLNTGG